MANRVSVKLDATKEQIEEMRCLIGRKFPARDKTGKPLPYSPLGEFLINNFGEEISDAIRKEQDNGEGN